MSSFCLRLTWLKVKLPFYLRLRTWYVRCFCQALGTQGRAPSTIRGYLTSIAAVHKSAGFPDPTAHYLTRRLIKGLVLAHGTVDDRDPLSEQDLTSLLHVLRHVGCSSYNLSLFRAMFVLMFLVSYESCISRLRISWSLLGCLFVCLLQLRRVT